jgi:transcriptional regulator with XRE-family HTH domain
MSEVGGGAKEREPRHPAVAAVGSRIRAERLSVGMTLRELARRLNVSPSFVSQLETGKSQASVATLYALCEVLDLPIESLFGQLVEKDPAQDAVKSSTGEGRYGPVVRPSERSSIVLETGVRWESLTRLTDTNIEFMFTVYPVGGSSSGGEQLLRHEGIEFGYVLQGELEVSIGFERYILGPGDAVSFDSATPHRFANVGQEPTHAVWFVHERRHDPRV